MESQGRYLEIYVSRDKCYFQFLEETEIARVSSLNIGIVI